MDGTSWTDHSILTFMRIEHTPKKMGDLVHIKIDVWANADSEATIQGRVQELEAAEWTKCQGSLGRPKRFVEKEEEEEEDGMHGAPTRTRQDDDTSPKWYLPFNCCPRSSSQTFMHPFSDFHAPTSFARDFHAIGTGTHSVDGTSHNILACRCFYD